MMDLAIYCCRDGNYLFVPMLCLPPTDAHHVFGPLRLRGDVTIDERSPTWRQIVQQVDRHLFATVSHGEARLLLGADHPCFADTMPARDELASYDDAS